MQHLSGVVPFVQSLMRVDSLVALETDQMTVKDFGKRLSEFGLADADLTLQQEWAAKF